MYTYTYIHTCAVYERIYVYILSVLFVYHLAVRDDIQTTQFESYSNWTIELWYTVSVYSTLTTHLLLFITIIYTLCVVCVEMCMRTCRCVYTDTHTYTHTHIHTYHTYTSTHPPPTDPLRHPPPHFLHLLLRWWCLKMKEYSNTIWLFWNDLPETIPQVLKRDLLFECPFPNPRFGHPIFDHPFRNPRFGHPILDHPFRNPRFGHPVLDTHFGRPIPDTCFGLPEPPPGPPIPEPHLP